MYMLTAMLLLGLDLAKATEAVDSLEVCVRQED